MRKYLFIFLLLIVSSLSSFAQNAGNEDKPLRVELAGQVERDDDRSLVYPVEVYQTETGLTVTFFNATDDVTIMIGSTRDVMETRTVSFAAMQAETFSLSGYSNGMYSIVITTPKGTYLYGYFTVEN